MEHDKLRIIHKRVYKYYECEILIDNIYMYKHNVSQDLDYTIVAETHINRLR